MYSSSAFHFISLVSDAGEDCFGHAFKVEDSRKRSESLLKTSIT
jgi:hypothetical protein